MGRSTTRGTVMKARRLRRQMTLPEVLLWLELRQAEVKFRKQHPVGPYVVDFYCPSKKLAIEVDGIAHGMGNNPERDERRETFLRERGLAVIRIPAAGVLRSPQDVAQSLVRLCGGEG
jgi:very-short-patch-repair endonuclease